jgi:hypothetical protein
MNIGHIAYIDESGDPGLRKVSRFGSDGSSEWLIIGGIVIKASREPEVVQWVQDIRASIKLRQRPDLHFSDLSPSRKATVCQSIAQLPLRTFVLCSNKKNMEGHRNPRAEKVRSQQWFYNWCIRLLLERITDFCQRRCIKDYGEIRPLKIEFSERRDVSYGQATAYHELLRIQSRAQSLILAKRDIKWQVLNPYLIKSFPHHARAGLQLADTVPSSFFQAVNEFGLGEWDPQFAKMLRPVTATERGLYADYGVALQPTPPWRANLTRKQQEIFKFYGYIF